MPVICQRPLRPLSREEFGAISYDVMRDLFAIHDQLGRFFDEKIYKRALAARRQDIELEVPVDVTFRTFAKRYYLDVLVAAGALLEVKATETFTPRHRAQLLHYLLLAELLHGLLVNVRPQKVTWEFVNAALAKTDRLKFTVGDAGWEKSVRGAAFFREVLECLLQDWGTCLDLSLYEEALTHFLGGEQSVLHPAEVSLDGLTLGQQAMRFAADGVAFKLTAFDDEPSAERFAEHARRLISHLDAEALLWANIGRHQIKFTTLRADRKIWAEKSPTRMRPGIAFP